MTKLVYLVCLTSGLALAACGASPVAGDDAGLPARRLDPLNTDSLGLAYGERQAIEARYATGAGVRLEGEVVSFSLVADAALGETAAGATLSDAQVLTDADGIARISVTAGAGRGMFRVRATASFAPPTTFYVSVSDAGFVALDITPRRVGLRAAADFAAVEVRIYGGACGLVLPSVNAGTPPETPMPPRRATGFDELVQYPLLPADMAIAVVGWAPAPGGAILAAGCVDLAAVQLRPGTTLRFELPLADVPYRWGSYQVVSSLSLAPHLAALRGEGWHVAACPRGGAQAVLDCAIDALDTGDPLDCVVTTPGAVAAALQARRGPTDIEGCRPAMVAAQPSLDALVQTALETNAGAPARALPGLAALLADLLDEVRVGSQLTPSGTSATHRLDSITLELGGVEVTTLLAETARPVLAQTATWGFAAGRATVGSHGFTLHLGPPARAAFESGALVPAGLTTDAEDLGAALVDAAKSGPMTGCAAISEVACTAVSQPANCLATACPLARPALDALYDAPFATLGASGLDLSLRGSAVPRDPDLDVTAERLEDGAWDASLDVASGVLTVFGTWTASQ